MPLRKTHPIWKMINSSLIDLPAPSNLSHFWNFGSMLGICLGIQIITGIFLAMHYSSDISTAFSCINHIMRDVEAGWYIRLIHANGASLFFFSIYIHMGRGLFFNSYTLKMTWTLGVIIFLISMMTAFLGYVLPWGQMSFWGATVITNLLSAVPFIGQQLVEWVWGGFSINNATLTRFFSLHYFLPFMLTGLVIAHLIFLHEQNSSNPMGIQMSSDKLPFHPYFSLKDLVSASLILFLLFFVNTQFSYSLMDPENFVPANPLVTPTHIQPEWYFLFAYAILRSIPNKLGGVIGLVMSIIILIPLTLIDKKIQNKQKYFSKYTFWTFLVIFLFLTWLGMKPVEEPFLTMSMFFTIFYFSWFFFIMLF